MKTKAFLLTSILFFCLLIVSCTTYEIPVVQEYNSTIPIDEAMATLDNALSVLNSRTKSVATTRDIAEVLTIAKSDIVATASDEKLAYVVNFTDGNGFALLAANRNLPDPIIAIVENGYMDKGMKIHNTSKTKGSPLQDSNFSFIEGLLNEYIICEEGENGGDGNSIGGYSTWSTYYTVDPMLRFCWGQDAPFNMFCPVVSDEICPTGCVPVALAMIITYNCYPTSLTLNGRTLSWSSMNTAYYYDEYLRNYQASYPGVQDVAYFLSQIGEFCDTFYTTEWSFTVPEEAKDFMQDLGYSNATKHIGYNEEAILSMLFAGKPVFIAAISGLVDGHAWVIDGLMRQRKGTETRELLHCNWGAYGLHNGYYASGVFDTTAGPIETDPEYNDNNTPWSYNFDWWYRIITY